MIREGIVKAKSGDTLEICFERPEACEKCGACSGGHTHLACVKGEAEVGDRVAVEMPDSRVLKISLLVYAVPLALLLAGLVFGCLVLGSDLAGALIGLALMAGGYVLLRGADKKLSGNEAYMPKFLFIMKDDKNTEEN